jgi:NAD(P)H dehydrogenase (quinone)
LSEAKILATGATGATGGETVRLLLERGHAVRAFVRLSDERSNTLKDAGAEIAIGDLREFETVRPALEGIHSAYFVFPIEPGILQATSYFAQAAKEAGVKAIVNMSQASARRVAKSHSAQDHWIAERVFDWSGTPVTHLRPTFFAEWVLYWAGFIKAGTLPLPFGTGRHAPIAADDQARVIANILAAPSQHGGQTYELYGPKEMTFAEMAKEVGQLLGKPVRYEQMDVPRLRELTTRNGRVLGDFFWQHLTEIAIDHQQGVFAGTNDVVERIGGRRPMTLAEFVEKHRRELTQ